MRTWVAALVAAALVGSTLLGATAQAAATRRIQVLHVLPAGSSLSAGRRLVSPHGTAFATVSRSGKLVVLRHGRVMWASPAATGASPRLTLGRTGNLVLASRRVAWSSGTAGSGRADTLTVSDAGVLTLRAGRTSAWTSRTGNLCAAGGPKRIVAIIHRQLLAACRGDRQLRVTPVTTGATSLGDGTPTGTWWVQARIRDTTLYPATGGAYPVRYWVPYDGAYGMHDSSWQHFAYGSPQYRTQGSHGCIHLPLAMMRWVFSWARVGTQVTVRA